MAPALRPTAVYQRLVTPGLQPVADVLVRLGIGPFEKTHRAVREYDAEAKGRIGGILLNDPNRVFWVAFLHEKGEVQPSRTAANVSR